MIKLTEEQIDTLFGEVSWIVNKKKSQTKTFEELCVDLDSLTKECEVVREEHVKTLER